MKGVCTILLPAIADHSSAHTREECEEKLKVLIVEMKAEIAEAKRLMDEGKGDGSPLEEKSKQGK